MYAQASFAVAQAKSKPHGIPWAVGFIALGQLSGATIALAIGSSLFLNKALEGILAVALSASKSEVLGALSGVGSALFRKFDQTTRKAALEAISNGISMTYVLAMTGAALTISLVSLMSFEKVCSEYSQIIISVLTAISFSSRPEQLYGFPFRRGARVCQVG